MHPTGKGTNSSYSPSFNSYFNTGLAEIAARVTTEFPDADDFPLTECAESETGCEDENGDEFEFEFDLSNLKAEDGEISPVYPVFNRDLLGEIETEPRPSDPEGSDASRARVQLRSLFLEGRDHADPDPPSSSSSSEAGDLEEILPETYCVWAASSPGRCTKSSSTGSSVTVSGKAKAWRLTDFLKRSKSDGKEGLLMMLPPKKKAEGAGVRGANLSAADAGKPVRVRAGVEGYYGRQGGENRRKSYLPYRQDLVGLFATPQAFRKMHLPPF